MLKLLIIIKIFLITFFTLSSEFYNFEFESIEGNKMPLDNYRKKVVLLVNTASMCGLTKQYDGLQYLHETYKNQGLIVLGIPSNSFRQEHATEDKVKDFCETNFNITFPMTKIEEVIGNERHPLYSWLKDSHGIKPRWNFHKVLIGKEGDIIESFSSLTNPKSKKVLKAIEEELKG